MSKTCPIELPGIEPIRQIGMGGFGEVWLARQIDFDRDVAVKVGRRSFTSVDDRRRFERECKALGRLTGHPHVIGVHTSGFQNDLPYLVMEYIDGGTLADRGPSMTEPQLRSIAAQLCDAVAAAHAIGVLHRDLKPENVFLRNDRTAVLGDFGIARLGDGNNTAAGQLTATLAYAAPEILNGHPASVQADIYGIGVTLAAAVMGHPPHAPSDEMAPEAIMARVFEGASPDLRARGLSREFAELLELAMDRDPNRRPRSADEFGERLRALSGAQKGQAEAVGQPATRRTQTNVVASPIPLLNGVPEPAKRSSAAPGVLAAVGLAAVGLFAVVAAVLAITGRGDETAAGETGASTTEDQQDQTLDSNAEQGEQSSPPGSTTTSTAETTTVIDAAEVVSAAPPLAMPLSSSEVSELTDIPIDDQGWDEIFGPANSPQFCDVRPDVTGLVDTTAALYPVDPTVGGNLQQVTIRMYRFEGPDRATDFLDSSTEIPCESWESDGSLLRAEATMPVTRYGEATRQVDQVVELPNSVALLTRSVFVRGGNDVMKLVFLTIDPADLDPVTDKLVGQAVEALGY